MAWPLSQDYNEAIQNPQHSLPDPELRAGEAVVNALGLPQPRSGNFADVYEFRCPQTGNTWALKCFTRHVSGLQMRYAEISQHLAAANLSLTVDFTYLHQGIRVRGEWYPLLKMRWVEGFTLNEFVRNHLDKPQTLELLCELWRRVGLRLREANIAHADLQHGNVLLVPGMKAGALKVRLIDYDGMWVPTLASTPSGEVGHPAYQHPQRLREGTYSLEVDRFPLLVIYTALRALQVGGRALWEKYDNGDNLLFREADFRNPRESALFRELVKLDTGEVRMLADQLSRAAAGLLEKAPLLEELLSGSRPESAAAPIHIPGPEPTASPGNGAATALQGELDFSEPASVSMGPNRRRERAIAAGAMKVWIGATAAAVVVLVGVVGGVAVWGRRGSPKPPVAMRGAGPLPTPDSMLGSRTNQERDAVLPVTEPRSDQFAPTTPMPPAPPPANPPPPPTFSNPKPPAPSAIPAPLDCTGEKGRTPAEVKAAQQAWAKYLGRKVEEEDEITPGMKMTFVLVPPGLFLMGSPKNEAERNVGETKFDAEVQHEVTITRPFYLGKTEVTQEQYQALTGKNPSRFKGASLPVEKVSWEEADAFALQLTQNKAGTNLLYRLPTEAEWEYACRGGRPSSNRFGIGDGTSLASNQANFNEKYPYGAPAQGTYLAKTCRVGSYPATALGLNDMHGNVWEWCGDWYAKYPTGKVTDPTGPKEGSLRVHRGGGWIDHAGQCRAAQRYGRLPGDRYDCLGFRLARVPSEK
jgi:formylglycine-generating enzyme required for sulfatase activity